MIQPRTVGSSGVISSTSVSSQSRISCAVVREARRALAFISGVVMGDGYFLFRIECVLAVYALGLPHAIMMEQARRIASFLNLYSAQGTMGGFFIS